MSNLTSTLIIPNVCNMTPKCPYCADTFIEDIFMDVVKWTEGLSSLNKYGSVKHIIGNGETFYNKFLLNIIENLSRDNEFSIVSNIIAPLENFKFLSDPSYIHISASFHPEYWNKNGWIEAFNKKIKDIQEFGFKIWAINIVGYPPYLLFLEEWVKELRKTKIPINIIHFCGKYGNKIYAESYDLEQLKFIDRLMGKQETNNESGSKEQRLSYLNSQGHLCYAGSKYIYIMNNGEVWSCYSAFNHGYYLGNIFQNNVELLEGPQKCLSPQCACEFMWDDYAIKKI